MKLLLNIAAIAAITFALPATAQEGGFGSDGASGIPKVEAPNGISSNAQSTTTPEGAAASGMPTTGNNSSQQGGKPARDNGAGNNGPSTADGPSGPR